MSDLCMTDRPGHAQQPKARHKGDANDIGEQEERGKFDTDSILDVGVSPVVQQ